MVRTEVSSLTAIIEQYGIENTQLLLSDFKCPQNRDVERFIVEKAIRFELASRARTYVIVDENLEILAYFSLTIKQVSLANFALSKTLIKRLDGFNKNAQFINSFLIGQIAKNFAVMDNPLGLGDILRFAIQIIMQAQALIGGRVVFVECEKPLIALYEKYDFIHLPFDLPSDTLQSANDLETLVYPLD